MQPEVAQAEAAAESSIGPARDARPLATGGATSGGQQAPLGSPTRNRAHKWLSQHGPRIWLIGGQICRSRRRRRRCPSGAGRGRGNKCCWPAGMASEERSQQRPQQVAPLRALQPAHRIQIGGWRRNKWWRRMSKQFRRLISLHCLRSAPSGHKSCRLGQMATCCRCGSRPRLTQ